MTHILIVAWRRVREQLRNKPEEVAKRLKWGRELWRKRPPRVWCVAIRASDTRITPMTARCVPEDAAYPREAMAPELRTSYAPHRVTLDVELLRQLCAPVRVHEWGEPLREVAQRLGRKEWGLAIARAKGKLTTRFDSRSAGFGQTSRAVLSPDGLLNPGAQLFEWADRVWGWTRTIAYWRLPDDLPPQEVDRVPVYHDRTRAFADKSTLHPEHPLVDPVPRKRPSYKLPPAPPDHVAYKWKGEVFVGYDWRAAETNPLIRENYERFQRQRARQRAYEKARRARGDGKPRAGAGGRGSLMFRGWMWLCPICGKRVKLLYYPLPPVNLVRGFGILVEDDVIDAALAIDPSLREPLLASGLACKVCHGVTATGRMRRGAWNEVVTYLSGGLLQGREVPKPPWFTPQRKHPFRPTLGRAPSGRRPQVQAMLLRGMTYPQIARELGLSVSTVTGYARQLLKQQGFRNVAEFRRTLGVGVAVPAGVTR
jgi:hypothetical protein